MTQSLTKRKKLSLFIITILVGFILFVLPDLFFGITKWNGGLTGINLFYTAFFQFIFLTFLIQFSLSKMNENFQFIGLKFSNIKPDALLGLAVGLT